MGRESIRMAEAHDIEKSMRDMEQIYSHVMRMKGPSWHDRLFGKSENRSDGQ
jgi:hypothetical protein